MGFGRCSVGAKRGEVFLLRGTVPGCNIYPYHSEALSFLYDELNITAGHHHRVD